MVAALAGALKDAAGGAAVTSGELERAKAAYKLAVLGGLDTRVGARDDAAAALLWGGAVPALSATLAAIDAVTAADVAAVAKAALAAPPALAAIGTLSNVPRYDVFAAMLK
jgi:predicted Zn-dependent peptidase